MNVKPLLDLLRRTKKSGYKKLIMMNRMIMGCYTVKDDNDVGLHYVLHIPSSEDYSDSFYDQTLEIDPNAIITVYKHGHTAFSAAKKAGKVKVKDTSESVYFITKNNAAYLKFEFIIQDNVISTEVYQFDSYPVMESNPMMTNILEAYSAMLQRIKVGGSAVALDGYKTGMAQFAEESAQVYYYKIKIDNQRINIPLYKSLLMGQKQFDEFFISIQETELDHIHLITYQFARNGLIEQFIGYVMDF